MKAKISRERASELHKRHLAGATCRQLGRELGCSFNAVRKAFIREGLEIVAHHGGKRTEIPPDELRRIRADYEAGMSVEALVDKYHRWRPKVKDAVKGCKAQERPKLREGCDDPESMTYWVYTRNVLRRGE